MRILDAFSSMRILDAFHFEFAPEIRMIFFCFQGNKTEYLSLVSLSTSPPQVSHGSGVTLEASHDMAALTALMSLAELGIDSIGGDKDKDNKMAAGDG